MATLKIELKNGNVIETHGEKYLYGAQVSVFDHSGKELGNWDCAEWKDDPESVMGAILSCASGFQTMGMELNPKTYNG